MRTIDLTDLKDTVERVRLSIHPELDASFLQAVIRAEEENIEDEDAAIEAIQRALKASLNVPGAM